MLITFFFLLLFIVSFVLLLSITIKITDMEITKQKMQELVAEFGLDSMEKHFGVSEVSKILNEKTVGSFDENKIYAFTSTWGDNGIYKLQRIYGSQNSDPISYAWVNISGSAGFANGVSTLELQWNRAVENWDFKIFDNVQDFAKWILEQNK